MKKILIIGGGAAGMFAAIFAARLGAEVHIFEKNEKLGKKLFLTGKGRCNVTNDSDFESFFSHCVRNPKFLYSAYSNFDAKACIQFFESLGLPLKIERGNRVFPVSDHSSDVIRALSNEMEKRKVQIHLHTRVKEVRQKEGRFFALLAEKEISGDACMIATGGLSYPATGSTGDGYFFAKQLGHQIEECIPSLVPIHLKGEWMPFGLSLKNVRLSVFVLEKSKSKKVFEELGELLFTHTGVSGPLILSATAYFTEALGKGKQVNLFLDLKPGLTKEQLDARIVRDFDEMKNKQFQNSLSKLLPQRLIDVTIQRSGINPEKKVHLITKEERRELVNQLKEFPLIIEKLADIKEAVITRGGISVKEVNPSTMESKKVKGVYFIGEILDVDALTGGFNLQIAWSTAYAAAHHAGNNEID